MRSILKLKNFLCFFLITFFISISVACNNKDIEKETARGYIWEATNGTNSVTLVGTMHIGDNKINFLNDDIKKIIDETDVLSVELDLSEKETINKVQSSGYLKNGETIDNYLTEDEIEKLSSIFKSLNPNFNIDTIKYLNPSSLYSLLTKICCAKAGILGNGLDLLMINKMKQHNAAAKDNIVINELEGADLQINIGYNTFTWNYIKEYINNYSNSNIDKEVDYAINSLNAYKNGDIEFIEESNNKIKSDNPEVYKIMITDRNIDMSNKIDELIKDNKKHTVAVGAGHFIGDDSILKLLEEKGYIITRIN
jgi:uncharacterized protein